MASKSHRFSFLLKVGVAIALVATFDQMFPHGIAGVCIGLFALAWLLGVILARPDVRQRRLDIAIALAGAAIFSVALAYDPGPLAWVLFWSALSLAALLPRTVGFDDAWRWLLRLGMHGCSGFAAPMIDIAHIGTVRPRGRKWTTRSLAATLGFPLIGTAIFIALFASANPLIANALNYVQLPELTEILEWAGVLLLVWPALRPHRFITHLRIAEPRIALPGISLLSVLIALFLFNLIFALENGLDIAFLWSGAALPAGMSMTEYVHRGAYPLIATALLAGLFALTMLRPGTATASNRTARRLVALWVAQNIFLVASSALRTVRYIEEFELTAWRIAALLWMALVAVGLMLICWRIWFSKSARWLINANALVATLALVPCCFVDLNAAAAQWNVRHAREVGGHGQAIDLCYLARMGAPALLPLIELEQRALPAEVHDRIQSVRADILADLVATQSRSWNWTPHGAIRLARAQAMLGPIWLRPPSHSSARECDGSTVQIDDPILTVTPTQ